HATQEGHQNHLAGQVPVRVRQSGELEYQNLGCPGETGQSRRKHESEQFEASNVVTERDRARLVFADCLQDLSEGRVDRPMDEPESADENRQDEVIEGEVIGQVNEPEESAPRDVLETVLAASEGRLQKN